MRPANRTISPKQWQTVASATASTDSLDGPPAAAVSSEGLATPHCVQSPLVHHVVSPPTPLMHHCLSEQAWHCTAVMQHRACDPVTPRSPKLQHRAVPLSPRMQHRQVPQTPTLQHRPAEPSARPQAPVLQHRPAEPSTRPQSPVMKHRLAELGARHQSPVLQHRPAEPGTRPQSPLLQHRLAEPGARNQSPVLHHRPAEPGAWPQSPVMKPCQVEPRPMPPSPVTRRRIQDLHPVPQSPPMQHRHVEPPRSVPPSPGIRPRHVEAPGTLPLSPMMRPRAVGGEQSVPVKFSRSVTRLTSEGISVQTAVAPQSLTRMFSAPAGQFQWSAPLTARSAGGASLGAASLAANASPAIVGATGASLQTAARHGSTCAAAGRSVSPVSAESCATQLQLHAITPRECPHSAMQPPTATPHVTPPRKAKAGSCHTSGTSEIDKWAAIQRSLADVDFSGNKKLSETLKDMAAMESQEVVAASIVQVLASMQQLPQQLCTVVGHLHKLTEMHEASSSNERSSHAVSPKVDPHSLALHHRIADWEADNAELRQEIGKRTVESQAKDRELAEIRATVDRLQVFIEAQNAKFHEAVRRQAEKIVELEQDRDRKSEAPSLPQPATNSHSHDEDYAEAATEISSASSERLAEAAKTSSSSSQPRRRRRKQVATQERASSWQADMQEEDLRCEIHCDEQPDCMTSPLVPDNVVIDLPDISTPADDRRLAPVAEDNLSAEPPPHPWFHRESRSKPGCFYYVNVETGDTTWDLPADCCRESLADVSTTSTGGGTTLLSGLCEERRDSMPSSGSDTEQPERSGSDEDEYVMPTPLRPEKHRSMPPVVEDPGDGLPLPEPWSRRESRSKPGCYFFVNRTTGETTWQVPAEVEEAWARDSWGETASESESETEVCPSNAH